MESPTRISNIQPHHLISCSSGRRSNDSICASPEFEFWMVRNPSFPQTNLHSADELFVDGILRPLQHLQVQHPNPQNHSQTEPQPNPQPVLSPASITAEPSSSTTLTSSKRWTDIFKKSSTNHQEEKDRDKEKDKEKKKKKKGVSTSTLNTGEPLSIINIWPFSRSRSAGNNGSRGRMLGSGTRKVSSAPCSRSNSGGESKTRKWPSSPSRAGGVHLGRSSPVWQLRRTTDHDPSRRSRPSSSISSTPADGNKARVLNFNVPNMCIGYGQHLSCRSDENSNGGGVRTARYGARRDTGTNVAPSAGNNNLFNLRTLFSTTKKVH